MSKGIPSGKLSELAKELQAPFLLKDIEWKPQTKGQNGSALCVTYADARVYQQRLDDVLGPANWYDTFSVTGSSVVCTLFVNVDGEWVGKTDTADNTKVEATKGGFTDAFKRACVKWGVGRFLYFIPSGWGKLDQSGYKLVTTPRIPAEFLREDDPQREAYLKNSAVSGSGAGGAEQPAKQQAQSGNGTAKPAAKPTAKRAADTLEGAPEPRLRDKEMEEVKLQHAYSLHIPEDLEIPLSGNTLKAASSDPALGHYLIAWLAGAIPNQKGDKFSPPDGDNPYTTLQEGARHIYAAKFNSKPPTKKAKA